MMNDTMERTLRERLARLQARVAGIEASLREGLPADFEEQAGELEDKDALPMLEDAAQHEIIRIEAALKRIAEGRYGVCSRCGEPIAPARLTAVPWAATCVDCSA